MLTIVTPLLASALLSVALWTAGGLVLPRAVVGAPWVLRELVRCALGSGVAIAWLFILASLGQYRPLTILAGLGLLALCGLARTPLGRSARSRVSASGGVTAASWTRAGVAVLATLLVVRAASFVFDALDDSVIWDADVYHLTLPRLYLAAGGFYRVSYNVYSNWPQNLELLFGVGLLDSIQVANLLHVCFGLAAAASAALLADGRQHSPFSFTGLLAATLFLINPVVGRQIATASVDCAGAFYFGIAGAWLLSLQHGAQASRLPRNDSLTLSGLLCGLAAGIKLNGILAAVALGLSTALFFRGRPAARLRAVLLVICCASLLLAPWLLKSLLLTGNPVYPLFYDIFGGPEWNTVLGHKLSAWLQSMGMGRTVMDFALLPWRVLTEAGDGYQRFYGHLAPLWSGLVPLAILAVFNRRWADDWRSRFCLLVTLVYFILWAIPSQQLRFLIPVLPFLAAAVARVITNLLQQLATSYRLTATIGCVIVSTIVATSNAAEVLYEIKQAPHLVATREPGAQADSIDPIYPYLNRTLPPRARVLMINHNRGFRLARDFIADSFFEASQIEATFAWQPNENAVADTLAALGITHILLASHDYGLRFAPAFGAFLNDPHCVTLLHESADRQFKVFAVERLRSTAPAARQSP